ncbi:hypothetical protein [Paenarthrobacter sp. YJN-5]|uniref:hypothetical protein n=1 Tax=Paenarthrobacter sp. YJN-5 TaxID=2735316 RepID=UPI0018776C1E|nr:hypothetical protein [Paenarthrobacter sp. YJN-5]QOT19334.1 hypothetical protein HMI59_22010 [Paenarthrobacter sp. YJN-5]
MTEDLTARQPKGVPTGGQFAATTHTEPDIALNNPITDPFAHLTGLDRARAQAEYAQTISAEAAAAYVDHLSDKLLAINPDFTRLNVGRKHDIEYGLTFTLESVEDRDGNYGDVDLEDLQDEIFHDAYLYQHVAYDDASDECFINLSPRS